ncbi:MAG: hypothetical protein IKB05_03145 [Alphaproteobacteria bacterium]|nr:hypothetical protein [Alphaproteobacteria bacterium]
MRNLFIMFAIASVVAPAWGAMPASSRGRASMANQMEARAVSKKYINNMAATNVVPADTTVVEEAPTVVPDVVVKEEKTKDMREREKAACIQNNIGVGATFVWASKYSNSADYNSMIEDVEFPENNVCFVKVGLKSNDSRINVSDVPTKYFVMGENITCGEWANEQTLKDRILDAKKKGRTWATVGGAVGGAGIGVGAMELFGNKLIGGAVEGQAGITNETELLCSQMKVLHQEKSSKYNDIRDSLTELKKYCDDASAWPDGVVSDDCKEFDYNALLKC